MADAAPGSASPPAVVVHAFLAAVGGQDTAALGRLLTDDVVLEFPYDEGERPWRHEGRGPFVDYFAAAFQYLAPIVFEDVVTRECTDARSVIAEFRGRSRWLDGDRPYDQRYIAVIETDGSGAIGLYREYRNPLRY